MARQGEVEDRAARGVGGRPQPPAMGFDDRAADRKSEAQSVRLRRVEGLEEIRLDSRRKPWTRVAYGDEDVARLGLARRDPQFARALAQAAHGLDGVQRQVEEDLLQFDPVAANGRQAFCKLGSHGNAVLDRFAAGELDQLANGGLDVGAAVARRRLLDFVWFAKSALPARSDIQLVRLLDRGPLVSPLSLQLLSYSDRQL